MANVYKKHILITGLPGYSFKIYNLNVKNKTAMPCLILLNVYEHVVVAE